VKPTSILRGLAGTLPLLALAAAPLSGQTGADTVRYTLALADPAAKLFRVTAEFPAPGDELLASLPAWSPGSYTIEDYARNVRNFSAVDGAGRPLVWDKQDPDTWRVRTAGAGKTWLSFEYFADSLDLEKSKILDDFAFFNGTNLFPFQNDRLERPAVLTLQMPAGWKVATGLPRAGDPATFRARNYDELVDAPTFLGDFQLDSFTAGGKPAQLAVYPAGAFTAEQRERIRDAIDRILTTQNALVGAAPYESYTVLLYVGRWGTGFAGGLEHANSHFDILDPAFAEAFDQAFPLFQSLLAHETFHLWNVKRIRPAAMWPYDYDEWQPTELLWFSEGVTDYYADATLVRSGLYTAEQYLGQIETNLGRLESEPGPVAVEDASLNTWLNPTHGDPYVYYPKGSLIGLLLDLRIRHASRNQRSLDTVLRELYGDFYSAGHGFTTADLLKLLKEAGAGEVDSFYARYITGREPLPLAETFAMGGLRLEREEITEPELGISGAPNQAGEIEIGGVEPNGFAARAGILEGDVLLALGEVEIGGNPAWLERFRRSYADKPGAPLPIRIRRNGSEQVLSGEVRLRERVALEVTRDPAAGPLEETIFRGLTGAR
jgi:predicted metalloprotease with PDZ domain